ncbi:hypothetical protein [Grimontia hollisae]
MTHCLFARDVCVMTARLDVRFIKPIPLNQSFRYRLIAEQAGYAFNAE